MIYSLFTVGDYINTYMLVKKLKYNIKLQKDS